MSEDVTSASAEQAMRETGERPVPTYQYVCNQCGDHLEVHQGFHDDPLKVCPACQGELRKVFSAVGVVFKGSGFYKTDSRQADADAKAKAEAAASSSNGSGGSTDGSSSSGSSSSGS